MKTLVQEFEYSSLMDETILSLYQQGASSTKVAVNLGITRSEFDTLRLSNTDFNRLCEYGENLAEAALEDLAHAGARGEVKNFNGTMIQFLLKSQFGERYNDKKSNDDSNSTLLEQITAGSLKIVRNND